MVVVLSWTTSKTYGFWQETHYWFDLIWRTLTRDHSLLTHIDAQQRKWKLFQFIVDVLRSTLSKWTVYDERLSQSQHFGTVQSIHSTTKNSISCQTWHERDLRHMNERYRYSNGLALDCWTHVSMISLVFFHTTFHSKRYRKWLQETEMKNKHK